MGDKSVLDELPSPWAKSRVAETIVAAIEVEAPVHRDRLAKLVASAFGLGRVSEDRRRAIQRVVPPEFERKDGEGFTGRPGSNPIAGGSCVDLAKAAAACSTRSA